MSKLQSQVREYLAEKLGAHTFIENYRPDWLRSENGCKLELDFYLEDFNLAFEIQGIQHFEYNSFFHKSYEEFESQQRRDVLKRFLCDELNILLVEVVDILQVEQVCDSLMLRDGFVDLADEKKRMIRLFCQRIDSQLVYWKRRARRLHIRIERRTATASNYFEKSQINCIKAQLNQVKQTLNQVSCKRRKAVKGAIRWFSISMYRGTL